MIEQRNIPSFIRNVILKTFFLFFVCNLSYAAIQPLDLIAGISAYNTIFPGRPRLPFGERPDLAYNLTISNLNAMFSAHEINASNKNSNDFRIIMIGDSSVWGYLLKPQETLSEEINRQNASLKNGQVIRAYNLGYPTISLTKDLLILQQAVRYQPDMIVWLVTLEAFPRSRQLNSPLLEQNSRRVINMIQEWDLQLDIPPAWAANPPLWQGSILSQRRDLAEIFRLQMYGVLWSATGIDQVYPETIDPPMNDLDDTIIYDDMWPPGLDSHRVAFDLLQAGTRLASGIPLLVVNEPIFRSSGTNSDIRYNYFYPRWAFDEYREKMRQLSKGSDWQYIDAWDLVAPSNFTNSAIHMNASGSQQLAREILRAILSLENDW